VLNTIATPVGIAMPTSAEASARASSMPSPTIATAAPPAVKFVDSRALIEVELAARLVHVASANCEDDEIETAIRDTGYTPVRH